MIRKTLAAAGLTAALAATIAVAAPASAASGEVRKSGACSSASVTWKLKAKARDGRIEVEFEVDSNKVGQTWAWRLQDNGVRVGSGTATTVAPSGSFSVERKIANRSGADNIKATATRGSVTCNGALTF